MNKIVSMQQVHGNNVVVVDKNSPELILNCDGLITRDPEVTLIVQTADCLPISIQDDSKKVIALLHAGWRGLQKEIIKEAFNKLGSKNIKIIIGPHICEKCYEVQDDVASLFNEIRIVDGKKFLDLSAVAVNQLLKLGIKRINIEIDPRCTFEDTSLPSYRRGDRNKRLITKLNI